MKKRILYLVIGLIIGVFIGNRLFYFFHFSHQIQYNISFDSSDFVVLETFNKDSYDIEISLGETKWKYKVSNLFHKNKKILKDLYLYQSQDYTCILPVFKDKKILFDVSCVNNNDMVYYHSIRGKDKGLDDFVQSLSETIYPYNNWVDTIEVEEKLGNITFYSENMVKGHYIGLSTYKGVALLNSEVEEIPLFSKDVYDLDIQGINGKYILLPNYNDSYSFRNFYLIDITSGKKWDIKGRYDISFDSYIQGYIDDCFYLVDISNKKQYCINTDSLSISLVGSVDDGFVFYDGNVLTVPANNVLKNKLYFGESDVSIEGYEYVDINENYYYVYEESDSGYSVYRMDIEDINYRTYLFSVSSKGMVYYIDDYVYFEDLDYVYVYHDSFGIKKIFHNKEFSFNDSLFYSVYKQ